MPVAATPQRAARSATLNLLDLVNRIREGHPSGMEDLYRIFSRGVRFYLSRQLGVQDMEDKVHDTFLIVVQAIVRGDLREPERLMGYIRTVVRRQVAAHIESAIQIRKDHVDIDTGASTTMAKENPEDRAQFEQKVVLMERVLTEMSKRDREILTRFYLDGEEQERICEEMALSENQFRLLKSRAKSRFGELGRRKVCRKQSNSILLRKSMTA